MKVGFGSTDWSGSIYDAKGSPAPGGANYVRFQQCVPYLPYACVSGRIVAGPNRGVGVLDWRGTTHYDCDVIIMQRAMHRMVLDALLERQSGPPIINDLDDWYWGLHPENRAFAAVDPHHNIDSNIDIYKQILQISNLVTVSTPFLQEKVSNFFNQRNVRLIENCVDVETFYKRRMRYKRPIVGWVGSTGHRSGDLDLVAGLFGSSTQLHHSGHFSQHPYFADLLKVKPQQVRTLPLMAPSEYVKKAFCFDIGIAPLTETDFNTAKSAIKILEYAAAGVPFIASPSSEYKRVHTSFKFGRIAVKREDWLQHIHELRDTKVRAEEARHNLRIVAENFAVDRMAAEWMAAIESVT